MNLGQMIGEIGPVGMCVLGSLLALSLYTVALTFDRLLRFSAARRHSNAFLAEIRATLTAGQLEATLAAARRHDQSPVAAVVAVGVAEWTACRSTVEVTRERIERVTRAVDRSAAQTLAEMSRGLGGLATIASIAPFIGLFGTVVGIINAFDGIAATGSGGIAAVSGGVAEALVATAFGIFVAIPALAAFNHFTVAIERFRLDMNTAAGQVVDFIGGHLPVGHAPR